jgi:hypothetical protein
MSLRSALRRPSVSSITPLKATLGAAAAVGLLAAGTTPAVGSAPPNGEDDSYEIKVRVCKYIKYKHHDDDWYDDYRFRFTVKSDYYDDYYEFWLKKDKCKTFWVYYKEYPWFDLKEEDLEYEYWKYPKYEVRGDYDRYWWNKKWKVRVWVDDKYENSDDYPFVKINVWDYPKKAPDND